MIGLTSVPHACPEAEVVDSFAAPPFEYSAEVRRARAAGSPVLALESTLIAHGLPWPVNLETAREAEAAARAVGAAPATAAVIDGIVRFGLTESELERLARGAGVVKASARDLPALVARRGTGALTVAGTLFVAHRASIPILATGGLGGVHRGAHESWDVSADLPELARTPVTVVCSGAKSILDLPLTLEYLETHGVAVVGYGTDELPGFLTASTGYRLEHRVDSPEEAAVWIRAARSLGVTGGLVLANPPPPELALQPAELESMIREAIGSAERAGIRGKGTTPYLLGRLETASGGRSLAVNRALVVHNAHLAAQIACALARLVPSPFGRGLG